jgi:DNA repair exonuclease SbcCD ATPase subunit
MSAASGVRQGVLLACLLPIAACSSKPTATEVPPQTAQGLMDIRASLVSGKSKIQQTTDAARDLTQRPQAQIEPQINRLVNEVEGLDKLATQSRAQFETQMGETQKYFAQWDAQLKTMTEEVQETGQERRAESMASFKELDSQLKKLRSTFRPYMDALNESAKYLRADPTAAGVKSISPRVAEALNVEKDLMAQIDVVTAQIDTMRGSR